MATVAVALKKKSSSAWFRPRNFVWALIACMFGYVLVHNESFLVNMKHPIWNHYEGFKWYLLPHGLAGACALLLGPMQFFDNFRNRHLKLHRVAGRIYIFGALVAGPIGTYIQVFEFKHQGGSGTFILAAAVQSFLWSATTLVALVFALRRKINLHRQWMTRSFAVALVFLEVRVIAGLGGYDGNLVAIEAIVWICNGMALLLADVVNQWQDFRTSAVQG